jgi:hypothetical protein
LDTWGARQARLLDPLPTTDVIRVVHTLRSMTRAADREQADAQQVTREHPTLQTAMDALSAQGLQYRTRSQYDMTWDYMGDRLGDMSLEDLFAEHERMRRGGGGEDYEPCRAYVVGRYLSMLDAHARDHSVRLQELRVAALTEPRFVPGRAVEREIAFWTRWEGFLVASGHTMDTEFRLVRTRVTRRELGQILEQALDNLWRSVVRAEREVRDIERQWQRWRAVAPGGHIPVSAACRLRSLERELAEMILGFAMLGAPAAVPAAGAAADA